MNNAHVSRRALLRSAALIPAAMAAPAWAQELAGTPPATRFRSVAVDVTPLLDHGGGAPARAFHGVLLSEMRATFSDRLGGGGPVLTARITNLFLASYSGRDGPFAFGNNDNIEGDGIVSAGNRVLSSTHILTELPPQYSGQFYTEDIDGRRLQAIAHQFAYWLRREMNG